MFSAANLGWSRNIEILNLDGTKGRGVEEMVINNEPVFFGGMNRAPGDINAAFKRRVCFKTCVQFDRADLVTFENAKLYEEETREDPDRNQWVMALRTNAKLHMVVSSAEFCGIILPPDLSIWHTLVPKFRKAVESYVTVANFNDRLSDAKTRLSLLTRLIAIMEVYQTGGEDQILTFDAICSKVPEVERCSIAGERLCLAVLSSLDDSVFPLMHRVVLHAISKKWTALADDPVDDVYVRDGVSLGKYALLPINAQRPKNKEDVNECAKRIVYQELRAVIAGETKKYKLDGSDALAAAAIVELMSVQAPDHPVIVVKEDASDQTVSVYISLKRLETMDMTIASIITGLAKREGGTQLMMLPFTNADGGVLPQLPAATDHGTAEGVLGDDAAFAARCAKLHMDPADSMEYYLGNITRANDERHFPYALADATMRSL
jgi:hypothetical protein